MPEEASAISNNCCLFVCCVFSSFQVLYRGVGVFNKMEGPFFIGPFCFDSKPGVTGGVNGATTGGFWDIDSFHKLLAE